MNRSYLLLTAALGWGLLAEPAAFAAPDASNRTPLRAGQPQLAVSPAQLSASVPEASTVVSAFQVWNGETAPKGKMLFILSTDVGWMSFSLPGGLVSNNVSTISATFSSDSLAVGTYVGTITIDAFDALTGLRVPGAPAAIALTMAVTQRTPINFEKPVIQGIPYVGQTVSAWPGLWQNVNSLIFTYQWQMANDSLGNGLVNVTNSSGALITSSNCTVPTNCLAKYLRVQVTAIDPLPVPLATSAYSDFTSASRVSAAPADFSGDGLSDLWLFDPLSGTWWVAFDADSEASAVFGSPDCSAYPGDYDGDSKVDPATYAPSSGLWSAMLSANNYGVVSIHFGEPGQTPVPADFDGDGKMDPAIYDPASGRWSVLMSANNYRLASCDLGGSGFDPVVSDYDGDAKADPAIYQPATGLWLVMLSASSYATVGYSFGGPDFIPAPGDYDGDAKADLAVFWAAGNTWWLRSSRTGVVRQLSFGTSNGTSVPAPGYFDRDASCDPATVYANGDFMIWCVQRSNTNLGYRGQSFQFSLDRWRVSW